ncbi:MAG TPA: thioredoxin-disulfide reductase [Papillibacter sp.]|jgi:thioredoxin reductase (NADPH)|nr:thioredoxin-disulfide reductase [Papillibacter sp.]
MSLGTFDVLIIGGGPGGYSAALYCARAGLKTLVVEKLSAGGQMALAGTLDNYPGYDEGIDGFELGERMKKGAERFGAETVNEEVVSVDLAATPKRVTTNRGDYLARTVVIATGATHKELGLPEEKRLVGRGVAYCATCDGARFKGKRVVVVGGGNSAVTDALTLAALCEHVTLVHRRDTLSATQVYFSQIENAGNITFIGTSDVIAIEHSKKVTGVTVRSSVTGETTYIPCDGLFIAIGRRPATELFTGQVEMDENGYIIAGETTETSIPGVFAVGDVRTKPARQVITAAADGAVAAKSAEGYLRTL